MGPLHIPDEPILQIRPHPPPRTLQRRENRPPPAQVVAPGYFAPQPICVGEPFPGDPAYPAERVLDCFRVLDQIENRRLDLRSWRKQIGVPDRVTAADAMNNNSPNTG